MKSSWITAGLGMVLLVAAASGRAEATPKTRVRLPQVVVQGTRVKPQVVFFLPRSPYVDDVLSRETIGGTERLRAPILLPDPR
jgi:hypothetical protein